MTMQDSESYRILRNKPEIRKWFYSNSVISADEQRLWFENYLHKDNEIMFSIIYRNFFAGGGGIYHIDSIQKSAEIGRIVVDKTVAVERGVGKNAILAASQLAFQLGIKTLYANIYADNIASQKAFKGAGFDLNFDWENNRCYAVKIQGEGAYGTD